MALPLTSWDLNQIANALESLEVKNLAVNPIFGKIEVIRPDGDSDDVAGYFVREGTGEDSWYGFETF